MNVLFYTLAVIGLGAALAVFSYLDRIYRELGRVNTGRVHANLEIFEAEIEPRLALNRRAASATFSLLAHLWLVVVAVVTARGVTLFAGTLWEALVEQLFFLTAEVLLAMHLIPYVLLSHTSGRWLKPLVPIFRVSAWIVWPLRMGQEIVISLLHLSEEEEPGHSRLRDEQEAIEALVEAAQEEGIIEGHEAQLIEQVVEFGEKRVREVMTPRPDIVAIPATATIEQLRRVMVESKFSRLPVYETTLDEVIGIVYARDLLQIPESEAGRRTVRELIRPAVFVPETKLGSQMLKEMQQKNQQMALVIDEYGSLAGLVTVEDLIEEIVGEIGEEDRPPAPDVVREGEDSLVLRGSVSIEKLGELFGVELARPGCSTLAGLLNSVAGHVPVAGEVIEYPPAAGLRFEVLEANQRKVLRLRARRPRDTGSAAAATAAHP